MLVVDWAREWFKYPSKDCPKMSRLTEAQMLESDRLKGRLIENALPVNETDGLHKDSVLQEDA